MWTPAAMAAVLFALAARGLIPRPPWISRALAVIALCLALVAAVDAVIN